MLDYNSMQTVNFFNLPLVSTTPQELPSLLSAWMEQGTWLVTANAEMLLRAQRQPSYAAVLRQADVLLPDGFGLVLWSRGLIKYRFPGVDLTAQVLDRAEQQGLRVVCVVSAHGLSTAAEVQSAARQRWPHLSVTAIECDPQSAPDTSNPVLREAQVVLVNFGVPRQDEWLAKLKQELPRMKIGIGVGGTFEFWVGKRKRAPIVFRKLGLEWLWRLITQPWRTIRVWNALVVFSWHALWHPPVASPD
jgi:N-acetylglucosaminyldiphosphoundecaprenol N-acetyl-beta-D-mannosaminyltransferase